MPRPERAWPVGAALAVLALLPFLPALGAGFAADDFVLLQTADAAEGPLWPFARNDLGQDGGAGHFYRPLWVLWHAGILELFGERAAAFHAANLLLFAVLVVEVWLLARRLLPAAGAAAAGAAFALYPRHGESVAWVSGSTDLLAAVPALAALLCLLAPWSERRRLLAAAALAAVAALAKEAAFVLVLLAPLVLWAAGVERREVLRAGSALAAALLAVFVARTIALGGLGGYGDGSEGVGRVLGASVSYALAALTPPQAEVLRYPALLVVPVAILGAVLWRVRAILRAGDDRALRAFAAGLAWAVVALLPVLGLPLDLNNSNGERLLLVPSVGLALAFGALLPTPAPRVILAVAAGVAALLCLGVARDWVRATELAEDVSAQAAQLGPPGGRIVLLSYPDSLGHARVLTNGLEEALRRRGRGDLRVDRCAPVLVRDRRAGAVRFAPQGPDGRLGRATDDAPFDFPVFGGAPAGDGCSVAKIPGERPAPGLRLTAAVRPAPGPGRLVVFDGDRLR